MVIRDTQRDAIMTFAAAFSFIVYEVFLSRFFAVISDNNYVFLTISLATLGIGLGGFMAYKTAGRIYQFRNVWLGLFALFLIVSVFVLYVFPYQGIWFYSPVALLPFFTGGALLAAIMQQHKQQIRLIYCADLAGAGIGAVSSIVLMSLFDPITTISLLAAILFGIGVSIDFHRLRALRKFVFLLIFTLLLVNTVIPFSQYLPFQAFETSPSNVFQGNTKSKVMYTEWNSFSRTDVYDDANGELLYITIDGGAVSPISKYTGDLNEVDYLRSTTSFLAFEDILDKKRALIIGAGGGQEVLAAQLAGFKEIEAVDINPGSFRAVQTVASFSGDVFNQPGVKAIVSDGRNYIRQTQNRYDLIYLSLVKKESENGLGLALTENYIFTEEAIREYLNKLKPGGRLAFLLHDESELMKVLNATEKSLRFEGIHHNQLQNHLAVIGTYQHLGHVVWGFNGSRITRPLVIVTKAPFSLESAQRLKVEAENKQQIPVHIPKIYDRYADLYRTFSISQNQLLSNRDDMPYFYNKANGVPVQLVILTIGTILITLMLAVRTKYSLGRTAYFSGLGIGFIVIETTLIQRLILPLGHPTLSFVLVLGVLLVSGGVGSLFFGKWFSFDKKRYTPLLWICVLTLSVNGVISWYNEQSFSLSLTYRVIAAGLILIPLGLFMGMPFPFGLTKTPEWKIALSWAINGLMTVTGSLLATMISLTLGFTAAMTIGALLYGLLYILQPKLNLSK